MITWILIICVSLPLCFCNGLGRNIKFLVTFPIHHWFFLPTIVYVSLFTCPLLTITVLS